MIDKLGNSIGKSLLTQIEPEKAESVPPAAENQELVKISNPAQETKVAQTMKGDLAMDGFLRRMAFQTGAPNQPPIGQTPPAVASTPPPDVAAANTLKLNSKGSEVKTLQHDLNTWRRENNLPEIATTGVYTVETEQAVKDFQKASLLTESGICDESTMQRLELENSPHYKALDPSIKTTVSSAYAALEKDSAGQRNLISLVDDAKFAHLISPDAQSSAIAGLMQRASSKHHLEITQRLVLDAAVLEKNKNFDKLPEDTKRAALNTMFYEVANGGLYLGNGTNSVTDLVTDPNFGKLTPKQQDQFLEIVRANPKMSQAEMLQDMMTNMNDMSPVVRARAIHIAHEDAMNANMTGNWQQHDERFHDLNWLVLKDPAFIQATDEDKLAQLNGLSGRTGL